MIVHLLYCETSIRDTKTRIFAGLRISDLTHTEVYTPWHCGEIPLVLASTVVSDIVTGRDELPNLCLLRDSDEERTISRLTRPRAPACLKADSPTMGGGMDDGSSSQHGLRCLTLVGDAPHLI